MVYGTGIKINLLIRLKSVSLEVAITAANSSRTDVVARGVEMCHCPPEYTSPSCQDPGRGYYRRYKYDYMSSSVWTDFVGEAARCQCNGRSETCDRETGRCSVKIFPFDFKIEKLKLKFIFCAELSGKYRGRRLPIVRCRTLRRSESAGRLPALRLSISRPQFRRILPAPPQWLSVVHMSSRISRRPLPKVPHQFFFFFSNPKS